MKRFLISSIAIALLVLLAPVLAGAATEPQAGGTLTFALSKDAVYMDPIQGDDHSSSTIHHLIYDQLVQYSPEKREVTPELAQSWEWSEDRKTLTMHLVQEVKFHNGEPLKADDVVYSWKRILDEENASPMRGHFTGWLEDVRAAGEYTIEIEHKFPFVASFVYISQLHVVPKDTLKEEGAEAFGKDPVGSGPFEFKEWIKGERLVMGRNEDYWMKKPYLEKVVMKPIPELSVQALSLKSGEVDLVTEMNPSDYIRLKDSEKVNTYTTPGTTYYYIAFNMSKEPFNDIRFRKAVYRSVDMSGAVNSLFPEDTGARAYGVMPSTMWASDYDYLRENVALKKDEEKAKELVQELIQDGVMEKGEKIEIWTPTDEVRRSLGTILTTGMKKSGFNVELKPTEWGTLIPVLLRKGDPKGKWDILVLGWTGAPDPDNYLYPVFHSSNAQPGTTSNLAMYENEEVDKLLDEARRTADKEKREELYVKAQRKILSSYVQIPAFFKKTIQATTDEVHGYILDFQEYVGLCNQWTNVWIED